MKSFYGSIVLLGLVLGPAACDDEDGESGDESSGMTSSPDESSGEQAPEGCVDGEQTVEVGDTRSCECMDGSASTQTCLSTGQFGICDCAGW